MRPTVSWGTLECRNVLLFDLGISVHTPFLISGCARYNVGLRTSVLAYGAYFPSIIICSQLLHWTVNWDFFYSLGMTGRVELCRRQMNLSNVSKLWVFLSNLCSKFSVIGSGRLSFYCTPYANIPDCFWKEKVSSDNMGRIVVLRIVSPSPAWADGNFASVFIQSGVGPLLGRFGNCILSIFALML